MLQSTNDLPMLFEMTGGTIRDCFVDEAHNYGDGAGVMVLGTAVFTMSGESTITNCSAEKYGGGVYVHGGTTTTFSMQGGTISSCTAKAGGGIYTEKNNHFTMRGGTVTGNTAHDGGAGIFLRTTKAEIFSGSITNNISECTASFGGGIYVEKDATLQLYNTVITQNTAAVLGGGLWTCSTGDIKIYITNGGAVYENEAKGVSKDSNQAGDDISNFWGDGHLTLYAHMLGGGLNQYYKDGGVTWYFGPTKCDPDCDVDRSYGTGAASLLAKRYGPDFQELYTDTVDKSTSIALKNVMSAEAADAAMEIAKARGIVITGNSASRGGGIGTNGNLIIGTESETYSVIVEKKWDSTPVDEQVEVSVYLNITKEGESEQLGPVKLNAGNNWTATFSGLTDDPQNENVTYAVVENPIPGGFEVSYSEMAIDENGNATFTITNTCTPPEEPELETGTLTISKTVTGNAGDTQKEFHFTVTLNNTIINGKYGGMEFANSVATFTLKHGESKTATGLPADTTYTVVEAEANQDGYTTSSTGARGTIPEDRTAAVAFVNEKNHTDPDEPDEPGNSDVPDEPDSPDTPNPPDDVPETGDETNLALWLMLTCFSGLAMILIPALCMPRYKGKHCKSKAKR